MCQTNVVEKIKTHMLYLVAFFFSENYAVCEIILKNIVQPDRTKLSSMRCACLITKATNTHSGYVIFVAFFHGNNGYAKAPQNTLYVYYLSCHICICLFIPFFLFSPFLISFLPAFFLCTRPDTRLTMVQLLVYSAFKRAYFLYDILNPNSRRKTTANFL